MTETNDDAPTLFVLSDGERDLDQLRELLAARGWRVEPSPDGLEEWIVRPDGSRAGVVRREPLSLAPPSSRLSIQGLIDRMRVVELGARNLALSPEAEPNEAGALAVLSTMVGRFADELASLLPTLPALVWQPIEKAPQMRKLIVSYVNALGKRRCVMACYYKAHSLEMHDDYSEVGEYNDATGESFAPEGWYEEHDSDEPLMPLQEAPTHWMPLPEPPLPPSPEVK